MKSVSSSGKSAKYIRPHKKELRVHINQDAYAYLKVHAPNRGIGQFISDVIDYHRDQYLTDRKIDKLSLNVEKLLSHFNDPEPTVPSANGSK